VRTLFTGHIRTLVGDAVDDWLLVDDGTVVATGPRDDAPTADRVVDLEGATVVPGFCDAHVHLPATGLYAAGLDFRGETSAARIIAAFAERAGSQSSVLFGGNFEDPLDEPLTRHELDRAVGDRPALLARADMHSCIVSTTLLDRLDLGDLEGVDRDDAGRPTGYLRERASAAAWSWFDANLSAAEQRAAVLAAVQAAYSKGVTTVHEMFVVEWRGWSSLETFLDTVDGVELDVVVYAATADVERVAKMGLERVGGDFFLDGSFGSHTAWLTEAYAGAPPSGSSATGTSYRTDAELLEFFSAAQAAGMQAGVHAIGDAAIEQAIATWEAVAAHAGADAVRALGHRIEHFECASDNHMRRGSRLGLRASVQPAFDRLWGGSDGLYARRMGAERAAQMNRFRSMLDAGMVVGAGSDSTVTPLDPLLQMASLREHHVAAERLDAAAALRLHTAGGHQLSGDRSRGALEAGTRADLAILDRDPVAATTEELLATRVLATWIAGESVYSESS
jgi:predicted amidohydrolase YtcJ